MKIDRLIGILSILLQQEQVTAPYLAERFEVSRRTINRDIDALCRAGIPVATRQGRDGGISIMEGYRIDRTLLTSSELQSILSGLRSLDSVSGTNRYAQLMDKLAAGSSEVMAAGEYLLIDLSSWYRESLAPKIEMLRAAIEGRQSVSFDYISPKGESGRVVEPYYLIFQWANWYVWGWCRERKDFRMFKLNRLSGLVLNEDRFQRREVPLPDLSAEKIFPAGLQAKIRFTPDCLWRIIEEFGRDSFVEEPDGNLLFTFGFADKDHLITWLLTFGDRAELLEPEGLRRQIAGIGQALAEKYEEG